MTMNRPRVRRMFRWCAGAMLSAAAIAFVATPTVGAQNPVAGAQTPAPTQQTGSVTRLPLTTGRSSTNVGILVWECSPQDPSRACSLNGRTLHPRVLIQTGSSYAPRWGTIGAVTLGAVVVGGVVGGEIYCFANCGDLGRLSA